MTIGIIGAGFTGLSAAYQLLKRGHSVTIFERQNLPGGMALGFEQPGWQWSLEEHYHHWFTNDAHILNLAKEIQFPVIVKRPKTSVYVDKKSYQLDSPQSVLSFPKLPFLERLRMAAALGFLRYNPYWHALEKFKATDVLPRMMGNLAYELLWKPQLTSKFGRYIDDISLAWFWARVYKRTSSLAYPEGGFLRFAQALATTLNKLGAHILFTTEVQMIQYDNERVIVKTRNGIHTFDNVIVTLPSSLFVRISPQLPPNYVHSLINLKGLGTINMVLRLNKQFLSDNTYWLSVCDKTSAVMAVVEHTNFMENRFYNNEHIVYLGNYVAPNHRYFHLKPADLLQVYHPFLKQLHPGYRNDIIDYHVFRIPFAQPIIPTNYSKILPPHDTPLPCIYLANIQQVYPWDRGTNYAVALGKTVVERMLEKTEG